MLLSELKKIRLSIFESNQKQYFVTYKQNGHEGSYKVTGDSVEQVLKQERSKNTNTNKTIIDAKLVSEPATQNKPKDDTYKRVYSDYSGDLADAERTKKHAVNKITDEIKEDPWDHVDDLEKYAYDKKTSPKIAQELKTAYEKHNNSKQTSNDDDELEKNIKNILSKHDAHSDYAEWYYQHKNLDR